MIITSAPAVPAKQRDQRGPRWLPRLVVHAYHHLQATGDMLREIASDRRMSRSVVEIQAGGLAAATERYGKQSSPDLLIIEADLDIGGLREALNALADVCMAHTRLLLVGNTNDIRFYRAAIAGGASDYLVLPVECDAALEVVAALFGDNDEVSYATTVAFIGAKGGVGTSTLALATANALGDLSGSQVILADLDPDSGGLDIAAGVTCQQTTTDVLKDGPRLDAMLLDRVLTPVSANLGLLAAPVLRPAEDALTGGSVVRMIEVARAMAAFLVLDLAGTAAAGANEVLPLIDKIVLVAEPDLISLRNACRWQDRIARLRGNCDALHVVLNKVGTSKKLEIQPRQFAEAVGADRLIDVPFDAVLRDAYASGGDLIRRRRTPTPAARSLTRLAQAVSGRFDSRHAPAGTWLRWLPWRR